MIDKVKLEALRKSYQSAKGGEMRDPRFRKIAQALFRDGDRRQWPFANAATLLGAPYRPDAAELDDFAGLEIALIGVPMDLGVTNRAGARLGPRAVRAVERVGPYEHVLKIAPFGERRIADIGDAPMRSRFSLEGCHEDIERFYRRVVAAGVVPLSVGGDHSITHPILKAVGAKRPVGMLHIDAHCDTGGPFEGSKFHHGGPFRQAVLDGVLDPERVVQIGIRGGAEYLWEFSFASGMTVIHAEELAASGLEAAIAKARAVIGAGPAYLSFDIDSLDPGFAPGTGTPEVGGLLPREALAILRGAHGLDFVGGDVVEVAPQYDATANTAQCAAQMLFTMLALACEALRRRGSRPESPRPQPVPRTRRPRRKS
ncbi:MAG TPA: agmatinase [Roseiarcus sp.]|nr:agmatinase [Roseiarcus sp.]